MSSFIEIDLAKLLAGDARYAEGLAEALGPMAVVGTRVQVAYGIQVGRKATITGWGRGEAASRAFQRNVDRARIAQRELADDDYECLIDSEGPVVRWEDDDSIGWFPGQSMGVIEALSTGPEPPARPSLLGHEPQPVDPSDEQERELLRKGKQAYGFWRAHQNGNIPAWHELDARQQALWADAIAGIEN